MASAKVLGVSLGTRLIGIAILNGKRLDDWQVKSFRALWSEKKLAAIADMIERYVVDFKITHLAIKVPTPNTDSPAVRQIISAIESIAKENGIEYKHRTMRQLKLALIGTCESNKLALTDFILQKYPELETEYLRQKDIKMVYHSKVFEAVAAADVVWQIIVA